MRMTLCVLWLLSSAGIAGITLAVAHKPQQTTVIQKTEPVQKINRLMKTDKLNPAAIRSQPQPKSAPPQFPVRRFWYA
jgi:hypothetical protein